MYSVTQICEEDWTMIELIIGSIVGAIVSLIIAEIYHRRASKETKSEIDRLSKLSEELRKALQNVQIILYSTSENTEIVKKHSVAGTPDDSNYPYK
jgi:gas vesicle protein